MAKPTEEFMYTDKVVPSSFGYPKDYFLRPALEQAQLLKHFFPELDISHVEKLDARWDHLPEGMDGIGVWPKPSRVKPPDYCRLKKVTFSFRGWKPLNLAMARLVVEMSEVRPEFDCELKEGPMRLRLFQDTENAYRALESGMPGDLVVLPVQTGLRHRGKSVRRVRHMMRCAGNEFGLDPFAVGAIILTHPERLMSDDVLGIDCPGADYSAECLLPDITAPSWWRYRGMLSNGNGILKLGSWGITSQSDACFGSASALLPE